MSYRVCWLIRQRSLTVPSNTWWGSELIRNQYDAYWNKQIERFRGLQKRTTFEWRLTLKIKSNLSLQIWKTVTFRSLRVSISASVSRPSEEHHVFRSGSTQFLLRAPDFSPHSKLFFQPVNKTSADQPQSLKTILTLSLIAQHKWLSDFWKSSKNPHDKHLVFAFHYTGMKQINTGRTSPQWIRPEAAERTVFSVGNRLEKAWLHTAVPHILQNGLECSHSTAYSAINKAIKGANWGRKKKN